MALYAVYLKYQIDETGHSLQKWSRNVM
uniref:Uncharacterized protein n=1 Tax=Anguilla anguilla TaxID=7936 RepID=A0A0E9P764_ANGAN